MNRRRPSRDGAGFLCTREQASRLPVIPNSTDAFGSSGSARTPRLGRGAFGVRWAGRGSSRMHGFVKYEAGRHSLTVKCDLRTAAAGGPRALLCLIQCSEEGTSSGVRGGGGAPAPARDRKGRRQGLRTQPSATACFGPPPGGPSFARVNPEVAPLPEREAGPA